VKAFSHGNITLGGNISIASGPTGRQCEAAGAIVHMAPIYSYSKSKVRNY
jgi:SH3 domain-containing YSC84-like protein 1